MKKFITSLFLFMILTTSSVSSKEYLMTCYLNHPNASPPHKAIFKLENTWWKKSVTWRFEGKWGKWCQAGLDGIYRGELTVNEDSASCDMRNVSNFSNGILRDNSNPSKVIIMNDGFEKIEEGIFLDFLLVKYIKDGWLTHQCEPFEE